MHTHIFERITIIGLGLIGSSVARAAHHHKVAKTIVGCDRNEISLAYAIKHDFINLGTTKPAEAAADSDLIILATPPSSLSAIAAAIAPHLKRGTIVMDVCSVKGAAIAAITPHIPDGVFFIPAHPIAGSQHTGVAAGRADLFEKKRVILTPVEAKGDFVLQQITSFWRVMGGRCEAMPAHVHDIIYAYVSHLPQLLAFAAAAPLDEFSDSFEEDPLLQKFLRLSGSDPDLWIDIFMMNQANLLQSLDRYLDVVAHVISELSEAPADTPISQADEDLARTTLFPRIAASCLITTVMEAEKRAGFSFARYAGTGFADFTYPASQPPEGDMESISNQYKEVTSVLKEYILRLKEFRHAISSGEDSLFAIQ